MTPMSAFQALPRFWGRVTRGDALASLRACPGFHVSRLRRCAFRMSTTYPLVTAGGTDCIQVRYIAL